MMLAGFWVSIQIKLTRLFGRATSQASKQENEYEAVPV
jgi:hypothetical protein